MITNLNILVCCLKDCICLNKILYVMESLMQQKLINKKILDEYKESFKIITTSTTEEKIDLKKIKEQINLLLQQKK